MLSKNEAQNIVVESNGEPYSVKYKNGIKTVGQMKIGATELAKNKDNTEPVSYTHLDVYKRQVLIRVFLIQIRFQS